MGENDQLDESIVPDPDDPGEAYVLPEVAEFDDDPVDPDADESPEEPEGAEAGDE